LNTEPRFRFCAIADCHFGARTAFADQGVIEDINRLAPDYTLVLGDISGPPDTGGPEATRRAVALLRGLKMPWRNIIGNHDLEFEGLETDRDCILMWLREHGYKLPWHREDRGPLTFLLVSTERFREHVVQPHEVYLTPRQFAWLDNELRRCANRPVVVASHAPILGSGVCVKPELHVRAGNAYLNQNHVPGQFLELAYRHRNVLFWFSGHSHLSHNQPDAITQVLGIHFVHVGTTSVEQAREIKRHSRVVDIEPERVVIRTFDHDKRALDASLDFVIPHSLDHLLAGRREERSREP